MLSRRDRSGAQKAVKSGKAIIKMEGNHMCSTTTHMYHMSPTYLTTAECFMTCAPTQHGCRPLQLAGHCNGSMQSKPQLTFIQRGVVQELLRTSSSYEVTAGIPSLHKHVELGQAHLCVQVAKLQNEDLQEYITILVSQEWEHHATQNIMSEISSCKTLFCPVSILQTAHLLPSHK